MTNNARYNGKASFDEWKKEWAMEERYNFHTIEAVSYTHLTLPTNSLV